LPDDAASLITLKELVEAGVSNENRYARIKLQPSNDSAPAGFMFVKIKTYILTFNGMECLLLQFQNLTQLRQNLELKAENRTV
jgi:hypothetical protein